MRINITPTRLLPLLVLFISSVTGVARAQSCATQSDGACGGACPRERPICAKLGDSGVCSCQGGIILEPFTEPDPKVEGVLSAGFNAILVGSSGGSGWLASGNSISFTQSSAVTVSIKHSKTWGGGEEDVSIPAGILRVVIRMTSPDEKDPDRMWFTVDSLSANLPSFPSVALGGGKTGDNVFSELGKQSSGWIDTKTGHFEVNVYAKYFNGVFCSAPALVQGRFEGTFDQTKSLATLQHSFDSISMISDSPSKNPAF